MIAGHTGVVDFFDEPNDSHSRKRDSQRPPEHVWRNVGEDNTDDESDDDPYDEMKEFVETAFVFAECHLRYLIK